MGLGLFKEALDDCQMAILMGYPEDKRAKIYLREGTCAIKIKDRNKLTRTIANLEKFADRPTVPIKCKFFFCYFYFFKNIFDKNALCNGLYDFFLWG